MNKEKLKQLMQEEGYEEISMGNWTDDNKDRVIKIVLGLNYIEELYFKPKEKPQEIESLEELKELTLEKIMFIVYKNISELDKRKEIRKELEQAIKKAKERK